METDDILSFNADICFYSASAIKFLVCLYIYEQAKKSPSLLEQTLILNDKDFKNGSGILKNNKEKVSIV